MRKIFLPLLLVTIGFGDFNAVFQTAQAAESASNRAQVKSVTRKTQKKIVIGDPRFQTPPGLFGQIRPQDWPDWPGQPDRPDRLPRTPVPPPPPAPPAPVPQVRTLSLYAQQKSTCQIVRAKYEYEAWVQDASGARVSAKIDLFIARDIDVPGGYWWTCNATTWCAKTDEVTHVQVFPPGVGRACSRSVFRACATTEGVHWCTEDSVLD